MINTWEQPQLFLTKPQKDYYSVLRGVKNFKSKLYLNNICDISFRVYEYENGERNELYSELEETQLIQALDYEVEWFQIAKVNERKDDVPVAYKDISCNSLEDELITKTVYDINGVFSLYNIEDTTKSLMHIITNNISWNIGYINPQISTLYRTLSIDSSRIYSLLTGELSKSFDCIFKFNREFKTISAYTLEEIGELTDIIITESNLLKSWEKNSNKDKIVTKMRVHGGTSTDGILFDIRKVNFGSDSISNYSHFKPRMSTELQTALNNWEAAIDTYSNSYDTNINLLKTYNTELNILNNDMTEIKSQISANEEVLNASLKLHHGYPPTSSHSDYTSYQNALVQISILNTQRASKQTLINNKQSQINAVNNNLEGISTDVDKSNFFTSELLSELDCFTFEGDDYVDDTFISTSETTASEEIQMALELKANAEKELHIACRPQPEFKATLKNLWSLYDEKDCVISYDEYRDKFKLGNLVTVILNDNSWTTIRIIGIELDYDNRDNAEITFSSRTRLDNSTYNLSEIQAQASRAYSAVTMNKYSWNSAASQTSSNEAFRKGVLNATLNRMVSDDNAQVETGSFGIKLRPYIESENQYGLNQMWLNPYRMLFTNDAWQTANSAFGLLDLLNGTQGMGINTEYLMGRIVISENLLVENTSGTYTINDSGFIASATIGNNIYSAGINPSTPSEIINVKINGENKFYIDLETNSLVMSGKINATSGTLGDLTVIGTLTGGTFQGSTINTNSGNIGGWNISTTGLSNYNTNSSISIYNASNLSMLLKGDGLLMFNKFTENGGLLGGLHDIYISNGTNTYYGLILSKTEEADFLSIGFGSGMYNFGMIYTEQGFYQYDSGFTFTKDIYVSDIGYKTTISEDQITIQSPYGYIFGVNENGLAYMGNAIIHSGLDGVTYIDGYSYSFRPSLHSHSEYALSGHGHSIYDISDLNSTLSEFEQRISALEDV